MLYHVLIELVGEDHEAEHDDDQHCGGSVGCVARVRVFPGGLDC